MGGRGVKESNFDNVKLENRLKICPECGNQVPTIAKYCPFCGKPLNDNSVEKNPTKKYIQIVAGALAIIVFAYIFWRVDIFSIIQKDKTDNTAPSAETAGEQGTDMGTSSVTVQNPTNAVTPTTTVTQTPTVSPTPTVTPTPIPTPTPTEVPAPSDEIEPVHVIDPDTNSFISIPDDTSTSYFRSDSSSRYYNESDISNLTQGQVRYLINEIYARNGYIFENPNWYSYFMQKTWYEPAISKANFTDGQLNSYEVANVKMISKYQEDHNFVKYG